MSRPAVPTSMRLAQDLKKALERAASSEGRSVASLTDLILRDWLTEKGFLPSPTHPLEVEIVLTGGNLRNGHIYLRGAQDLLPSDAIGGSNKSVRADTSVTVEFIPGKIIETDIDGEKMLFRERGAVSEFFTLSGANEDDAVKLSKIGSHAFRVTLVPRGKDA